MAEKKYQVFISSTYRDLREEREALERLILRGGDFPIGMEAFPAADEEQFEFIKTLIDSTDFYIVVVAGKYGTISSAGKSYTELEYDYAVERGVPVLAFVFDAPEKLPVEKSESDPQMKSALQRFIDKISSGRLRSSWSSIDTLQLAVIHALNHAKRTKNRPGWVRGGPEESPELLRELVDARKKIEQLSATASESAPKVTLNFEVGGLDSEVELKYTYTIRDYGTSSSSRTASKKVPLERIFVSLGAMLLEPKPAAEIENYILKSADLPPYYRLDEQSLVTVRLQLEALNLLEVRRSKTVGGGVGTFWYLSELGKEELLRRRLIRKTDSV